MWFVELLAMMFADILGSAAWGATQRASERRALAKNRVNCELRAVEGRVLNIGTEWSIGSGVLSRGHVRSCRKAYCRRSAYGMIHEQTLPFVSQRTTHDTWSR
jgi:hypothetical protein